MRNAIVIPSGEGTHAAAAREVSAVAGARTLAQAMTPQEQQALRQEIERATREATAGAREAARAAAAQRAAQQQTGVLVVPEPPDPPAVPSIEIKRPDGKVIHIGGPQTGVASSAQVPGPNIVFKPEVPPELVVILVSFFIMLAFIAVGLPIARAVARRMDRQGSAGPAPFPSTVSDRIERIEQAVEAIAIEVERVSEGQRFTTKLLSEMRGSTALGAGASAGQYAGEQR